MFKTDIQILKLFMIVTEITKKVIIIWTIFYYLGAIY